MDTRKGIDRCRSNSTVLQKCVAEFSLGAVTKSLQYYYHYVLCLTWETTKHRNHSTKQYGDRTSPIEHGSRAFNKKQFISRRPLPPHSHSQHRNIIISQYSQYGSKTPVALLQRHANNVKMQRQFCKNVHRDFHSIEGQNFT